MCGHRPRSPDDFIQIIENFRHLRLVHEAHARVYVLGIFENRLLHVERVARRAKLLEIVKVLQHFAVPLAVH